MPPTAERAAKVQHEETPALTSRPTLRELQDDMREIRSLADRVEAAAARLGA